MAKRKQAVHKLRDKHKSGAWLHYLPILTVLLVTAAVYAQVHHFGFAPIDDASYVSQNGYVRSGDIIWALTSRDASNWHPLTWMSHMLDCRLFGLDPGKHHITNLLLHLAATFTLFAALKRMTGSTWRGTFVAGLFALHPLHVESVAWIAERKDVLSALFWMLTMLAYASYTQKRGVGHYILVLVFFGLGLLSKPMLVSLPVVLLMLDFWPLKRVELGWRRLVIEKTPLLAMSAASCLITFFAQHNGGAVQELASYPFSVRMANAVVACAGYLAKTIVPVNLGPMYPHPGASLPVWTVAVSAGVMIALTAAAVISRRKAPCLLVGWLIYIVTLLPVVGLVQVGNEGMADRYTYIPLLGIFIAIAWLLPAQFPQRRKWALGLAGAAIMIILGLLTCHQTGAWRNTDTYVQQMLKATNNHPLSRLKEAKFLSQSGDAEGAELLMAELVSDYPDLPEARNGRANTLSSLGRHGEAIAEFKEAIRLKRDYAEALSNLGLEYESVGNLDEAVNWCRKAVALAPNVAQWRANLGHVYATQRQYDEAAAEYRKALSIRPDTPNADSDLGMVLYNDGDSDGGIRHLRRAVRANPDDDVSRLRLGTMLHYEGLHTEAIEHLKAATELQPASADAHGTLAMALDAAGRTEEAREELELAQRYGARR